MYCVWLFSHYNSRAKQLRERQYIPHSLKYLRFDLYIKSFPIPAFPQYQIALNTIAL